MFVSNWEEELVCEWLSLQGYFVEVNVPLTTGGGGGRKEADIVAVRADRGMLIIKHIEIGSLAESFQKNVERVLQKFDEDRMWKYWVSEKMAEQFLDDNYFNIVAKNKSDYFSNYSYERSLKYVTCLEYLKVFFKKEWFR